MTGGRGDTDNMTEGGGHANRGGGDILSYKVIHTPHPVIHRQIVTPILINIITTLINKLSTL
jgi:hypothetical protein